MEQTLSELATEIVNEIEREDFIYAIKHYSGFKIKTTIQKIISWLYNV